MARLQFLSLYYCMYFIINHLIGNAQGSTPFCSLCPCNSQPNQPVNINCIRTEIDIYNNSYWIYNFNKTYQIESLIYTYNNLTVLKTPFPPSTLKLLDLSSNSISEIGRSAFSHLQKMETLNLGNNNIEKIHPDVFRGIYTKARYFPLKSLKKLYLNNNKLHSIHADTFEHIDDLRELILHHNPMKVIDDHTLSAIASLVSLEILDLSYTQIQNLPQYFMLSPKKLEVLNLSGNDFISIPKPLSESHSLKTLYFNNNPVGNLSGPSGFPTIYTLKVLHMSQMPLLETIGAEAFGELENLEELHLSYNKKLCYIHRDAFVNSEGDNKEFLPITKMFMQYNNLSYLQKLTLVPFGNLTELDLRGNPWACNCKNRWLIEDLVPIYEKINEMDLQQLECASPIEMEGMTLDKLHQMNSLGKCLELYYRYIRPEQDTFVFIGVLSGVLTGVFLLLVFSCYYRSKKAHRKFYIATTSNDNYYSRI